MTKVIRASGTKEEVLDALQSIRVGCDEDGTARRLLDALLQHVDAEVDGGNRSVDVQLSIKYSVG